jgi:hypothetical protein
VEAIVASSKGESPLPLSYINYRGKTTKLVGKCKDNTAEKARKRQLHKGKKLEANFSITNTVTALLQPVGGLL